MLDDIKDDISNDYGHYHFRIYPIQDKLDYQLQGGNGINIAVLDVNSASILANLQEINVYFDGTVSCGTMNKRPKLTKKTPNRQFSLMVNICGAPSLSRVVSSKLRAKSIRLQHPHSLRNGQDYVNPQYFKRPGVVIDMKQFVGDSDLCLRRRRETVESGIMDFLDSDCGHVDGSVDDLDGLIIPLHR